MTSSPEQAGARDTPVSGGDGFRGALAEQEAAVTGAGSAVASAPAPYAAGGLGRHIQEIVEALGRAGVPCERITESGELDGPRRNRRQTGPLLRAHAAARLGRASAAWRIWSTSVRFDAHAAERLPVAEQLIAFNGTALAQLHQARQLGYETCSLVSANSHFRHLLRQHELAHRQYPLERPWPRLLLERNLDEYDLADRVLVASRYIRDSFLAQGFAEERLITFPLTPDPRFRPFTDDDSRAADTFDVLYIGSLTVHKGVPLLVDAFRRLPHADMRLLLIGGWKTPAMRRFIEAARAADPRISVAPGDPLPRLRTAALCVHPAYEDGFAYAPAEALACGVPVLVSEDTGMRDLIGVHGRGAVLATGDLDALTEALEAAYQGDLPGDLPGGGAAGA
jgi:glycosyltransferase involved in cell wall biosynthesis